MHSCLYSSGKMWSELLGQKTIPCPPGLLLTLELLHVYFSTCLPFCPYHKEVVELCCEPPGFFDDINHLRSFQKELHFTPDSFPSCAPLSFPQKKMLSSFVLNFKGSVTIQSLEQLSVVHSASYSIVKLGSVNSVLVVHSLYCRTPGSVSLVSRLAQELLFCCLHYPSFLTAAHFSRSCSCTRMFTKWRGKAIFMYVTQDKILE